MFWPIPRWCRISSINTIHGKHTVRSFQFGCLTWFQFPGFAWKIGTPDLEGAKVVYDFFKATCIRQLWLFLRGFQLSNGCVPGFHLKIGLNAPKGKDRLWTLNPTIFHRAGGLALRRVIPGWTRSSVYVLILNYSQQTSKLGGKNFCSGQSQESTYDWIDLAWSCLVSCLVMNISELRYRGYICNFYGSLGTSGPSSRT